MQPQTQTPPTTPQPLHSLLLIAKTRSGPRLVAYYPPTPPPPRLHPYTARSRRDANDTTPLSSDPESEEFGVAGRRKGGRVTKRGSDDEGRSDDPNADDDDDEAGEDAAEDDIGAAHSGRAVSRGRTRVSTLDALPPYSVRGAERKAECLAKLLAPSSRAWHKKRFEVAVEGAVFLGCPVFEKEGGGWGARRKDRDGGKGRTGKGGVGEDREDGRAVGDDGGGAVHSGLNTARQGAGEEYTHGSEGSLSDGSPLLTAHAQRDEQQSPPFSGFNNSISSSSMHSSSTVGQSDSSTAPEPLTMFNLVFVVLPAHGALAEYQTTVQDIYTHVVKQLSKALAYQQKRHGFVWTETRLIRKLLSKLVDASKDKNGSNGHDLSTSVSSSQPSSFQASYAAHWPLLAAKSQLAKAMELTYERISKGEIAHLTLGTGLSLALQIPLISTTPHVPTPMSPNPSGALWLTTFDASTGGSTSNTGNSAHRATDEDKSLPTSTGISPYSALLLLQDGEALVREIAIQPTTELSTPLTRYIRHSVPTKSLVQLSRMMKFSLQDIQLLSLHLIHYRRAIAIPPLNASHTYIISPNADFRRLPQASQEFGKRFAMLPSLISILTKISAVRPAVGGQGPQPWGLLIPSSDHKEAYMEILEWLMRGGWVTQLRTFCWVRVSAEVKAKVARQMWQEEREVAATDAMAALVSEEEIEPEDVSDVDGEQRRNSSGGSVDGPVTALSPRLKAHLVLPRPPSEAGSTSTARTAVRVSNLKPPSSRVGSGNEGASGRTSAASHEHRVSDGSTKSRPGLEAARDEDEPDIKASDFEPSIVASPHKANAVESRWLEHIADTLSDEEVRKAWPRLVKYFDGKHALEEIALREGWKRKVVAPMLAKLMRQDGLLLTVRHW